MEYLSKLFKGSLPKDSATTPSTNEGTSNEGTSNKVKKNSCSHVGGFVCDNSCGTEVCVRCNKDFYSGGEGHNPKCGVWD
jgi:hypothetical protein